MLLEAGDDVQSTANSFPCAAWYVILSPFITFLSPFITFLSPARFAIKLYHRMLRMSCQGCMQLSGQCCQHTCSENWMPAATSAAPSTAPCAWDRSMAKPQPLQCVKIVDCISVGGCIVAWWFEGVRQLAKQCRNSSSWIQLMLGTRDRDSTRPLYSPQIELHGSTHMTTLRVFILLLPDHVD
jgi:hypothetical protein